MADIAKMYRQIMVDDRDIDYQRILWRASREDPISEYQLLTVTYGTAAAPFLALRVLQQLVEDEGSPFAMALPVLQHQTYVDDCIFGADDLSEARQIRNQLIALLERGGFHLRKWASNTPQLVADLDPSNHGVASSKTLSPDDSLKVLGIAWNPDHDDFLFKLSLPREPGNTKRQILSTVARLFDPLGWVTPVIISAKILLQKLWSLQCDWDHPVPNSIYKDWIQIYKTLSNLEHLRISRWTGFFSAHPQCEIHAFADASSKAYAAVVYLRLISTNKSTRITLLISKSKVAPLKTLSVPRLELCAALLLARLLNFVTSTISLPNASRFCWTDSTIVLTWLSQSPSKWKTFVGNRVAKIQSLTASATWRHVSTKDNPADCASRGLTPEALVSHTMWWSGPSWLAQDRTAWPLDGPPLDSDALCESQSVQTIHIAAAREEWDLQSRYSSWPKLLRVTAYIQRFISRLRSRSAASKDAGSSHHAHSNQALYQREIDQAKVFWLKVAQRDNFQLEFTSLSQGKPLASSNRLSSLNPYIDKEGLLRVGGRLQKAPVSFAIKHPIILSNHPLLDLLIRHHHIRTLHAGPQLTLTSLRQEYWILRARTYVRAVIYQCIVCTRYRAAQSNEIMGNLPPMRVTKMERAFTHTGVDYAGPMAIKARSGRGHKSHKAYIALFICMTVKAIHLELVSDYSTAAFIAAYHRFTSRRGIPCAIYSDNGTTFQGANKDLKKAYATVIRDNNFLNTIATQGVQWNFIPPAAPHFGGLWEAAVKSTKHHLKRCVGAQVLTFEEMTTFLCRVEACLNSRPIAPVSDQFDNYQALTPGHFLIGTSTTASPEPTLLDIHENRLSRWQLISRTVETFWKAWMTDYIHTLQQRPKWRTTQHLAKVGQIVLIRNPNMPPSHWELGRITRCYPGEDGNIRVVSIRTSNSEYTRPITKICFLPVPINEQDEHDANPKQPQT